MTSAGRYPIENWVLAPIRPAHITASCYWVSNIDCAYQHNITSVCNIVEYQAYLFDACSVCNLVVEYWILIASLIPWVSIASSQHFRKHLSKYCSISNVDCISEQTSVSACMILRWFLEYQISITSLIIPWVSGRSNQRLRSHDCCWVSNINCISNGSLSINRVSDGSFSINCILSTLVPRLWRFVEYRITIALHKIVEYQKFIASWLHAEK